VTTSTVLKQPTYPLAALYTPAILRLAVSVQRIGHLHHPHGVATCGSIVCGSSLTVELCLDSGGRVDDFAYTAQACAIGQAAAALLANSVVGRDSGCRPERKSATAAVFFYGDGADVGDWPGITALASVRSFPARHAAALLPFQATEKAIVSAMSHLRSATTV